MIVDIAVGIEQELSHNSGICRDIMALELGFGFSYAPRSDQQASRFRHL